MGKDGVLKKANLRKKEKNKENERIFKNKVI